jgi:hypothetical protein
MVKLVLIEARIIGHCYPSGRRVLQWTKRHCTGFRLTIAEKSVGSVTIVFFDRPTMDATLAIMARPPFVLPLVETASFVRSLKQPYVIDSLQATFKYSRKQRIADGLPVVPNSLAHMEGHLSDFG